MKKKTIALLLVMVMIFGISVGGTIAYLTDKEAVTNTFTVGDVKIKLTETAVNEAGVPVDEKGVTEADSNDQNWKADIITANDSTPTGNKYKLLPGMSYTKDPTVTVLEGSEDSYVRMFVTISKAKELDTIFSPDGADLMAIFGGLGDGWTYQNNVKDETENTRTYEFWYTPVVNADSDIPALFEIINVPGEIDNAELATLNNMTISVVAHAIQAGSFNDAADAWGAWEN
ncbi:MAG: hypothetical protein J6D61_06430 [Clostridia bacterium]|nr:hypothetical protein [Clostridia bacterium]MBP3588453.1 hypothetical protein [Clostridia bacterium]